MDEKELQEAKENYEEQVTQELQNLAEYRKALSQEFASLRLDDPETAAKAKAHVIELVPDSASTLKWLIVHAESESIRKDIAKWVLDCAMKSGVKDDEDKELAELLKALSVPKTTGIKVD